MTAMNAQEREKAFELLREQALKLGYLVTDWVCVEYVQHSHGLTEEQAFELFAPYYQAVRVAMDSAGIEA
jgi:hypothetical protein